MSAVKRKDKSPLVEIMYSWEETEEGHWHITPWFAYFKAKVPMCGLRNMESSTKTIYH